MGACFGVRLPAGQVQFFSLESETANLRKWGDTGGTQLPLDSQTQFLFSSTIAYGTRAEWWPCPCFNLPAKTGPESEDLEGETSPDHLGGSVPSPRCLEVRRFPGHSRSEEKIRGGLWDTRTVRTGGG